MTNSKKQKAHTKQTKKSKTKKGSASMKHSAKKELSAAAPASQEDTEIMEDVIIQNDINNDDTLDVATERDGILSIVKDLEEQVSLAHRLKEAVENDLEASQQKLSQQSALRAELETRVTVLEGQAMSVDQLRQDISFVEEERSKVADLLAEMQPQLKAVSQERDSLTKRISAVETQAAEADAEKTIFEAQVMNLRDEAKDNIAAIDSLQKETNEVSEARRQLGEQVRDLTSRLEASQASNMDHETELAQDRETIGSLRDEVLPLRENFAAAENRLADLRVQLDGQKTANNDLIETRAHLEADIKKLNAEHKSTIDELQTVKNALRDIHSEAASTSARVRQQLLQNKG